MAKNFSRTAMGQFDPRTTSWGIGGRSARRREAKLAVVSLLACLLLPLSVARAADVCAFDVNIAGGSDAEAPAFIDLEATFDNAVVVPGFKLNCQTMQRGVSAIVVDLCATLEAPCLVPTVSIQKILLSGAIKIGHERALAHCSFPATSDDRVSVTVNDACSRDVVEADLDTLPLTVTFDNCAEVEGGLD